jgi:hypothetical protein
MIPMHMGAMHPYEQVLTLILAFGPFVVLAAVIVHRRRQDDVDLPEGHQVEAQRDR